MGIIEFPNAAKQAVPIEGYRPSPEEIKLIHWAVTHKAFGPNAKQAIKSFVLHEEGATLNVLSSTQMNALRTQAASLRVSLVH